MPKVNNTGSGDRKLCGNIPITQIQAPTAQIKLISSDERRWIILTIRGILKKGMMIPLTMPIVWIINVSFCVWLEPNERSDANPLGQTDFDLAKSPIIAYGLHPALLSCWSASRAKLKS